MKTKILLVVSVAIATVCSAWLLSKGIRHFRGGDPVITVTGKAERNIKSDLIVWNINVNSEAKEHSATYEELQNSKKKVLEYLAGNGVKPNEISTTNASLSEDKDSYFNSREGRYKNEVKGYKAAISITVQSNRVDEIETVYQKISELFSQNINLEITTPKYYYTSLDDLKMEMLKEASNDAYRRATIIAEGGNSSVGALSASSMGVFQIVGFNSNEEYSWYGSLNTSSKVKTVSVTVRSSYKIN